MQKSNRNWLVIAGSSFVLLLALILKVIPVINGVLIAFKDYSPAKGINGSRFTGFANMKEALASVYFPRVLLNTVRLNLLYLITILLVSFILAVSLARVSRVMQNIFITLILIPLFIPANALVHICFFWFKGTLVLTQSVWFRFIYAFLLTVKNVGIPTVFIFKTLQMRKGIIENNGFGRLMVPGAFILVQLTFILNTDMDVINNLVNPLVYETGDTLDYYIYRSGFMQMRYGVSQSIWLLQLLVQLVIGLISYFILYGIGKSLFSSEFNIENTSPANQNENPAGFIVPVLYSIFIIWFVFKPLVIDGLKGIFGGTVILQGGVLPSVILYVLVYGFIAFAGVPLSVLMAKSILTEGVFGKLAKFIFIFLFIAGGMGIHHYLFIRNTGLFNTIWCYVPYYIIPVTSSLVLAVILRYFESGTDTEHRSITWKAAFSLGILQFINMWNSEYIPMVFIARRDILPPVVLSKALSQGLGAGGTDLTGLLGMDLIVSLLPVALFLIFRKFITEWILLAYTKIRY